MFFWYKWRRMIAFNDQQLMRVKNKFHWTWNQSSCLIIWHERQIFSLTGNCYGQGELAGRLQIHFLSSIYAFKWKLNFTVIHLLLKCTFMPLCINWPELLWGVKSLDTYLKWQKSPDPRDCFWFCRSLSVFLMGDELNALSHHHCFRVGHTACGSEPRVFKFVWVGVLW